MDFLKEIEVIVGLVLTGFGLLAAGLGWWDKRVRRLAGEQLNKVSAGQSRTHERIARVEKRLGEVEEEQHQVRTKLSSMELTMTQLATKDDLSKISNRVAGMDGTVKQMDGKFDTLYRAALEARRPK